MVKGLDIFKEFFKDYQDSYLLIGGAACDIVIEESGLTPRATRDIDIILIVEAIRREFVEQFWSFINEGKYHQREKSSGEREYYRFLNPENVVYPYQIELFARVPDVLEIDESAHLTPIPTDDDFSSLSAILLDDEYYLYTIENSNKEKGIHLANTSALICLKAKAYLEMKVRKNKGARIDKKDIQKHKTDVFRLALILASGDYFELPESIKKDMKEFTEAVKWELPGKEMFKNMGAGNVDVQTLYDQLLVNFELS